MNLKHIRKLRKMTIDTLSVKSNVSKSYISDLENERKTNPSMNTLKKLSKGLDMEVSELIKDK